MSRLLTVFAAVALVACGQTNEELDNKDPEPEPEPDPELTFKFAAELVKAGSSTAQIKLTTENIAQYAYVVETADTNLTPDLIFATGTPSPCDDGDNLVDITSLSPDTDYVAIFAGATIEDEFYEEIVKVTFKTEACTE